MQGAAGAVVQGRVAQEQEREADVVVGLEKVQGRLRERELAEVLVPGAGSSGFQSLPSQNHCQG